MGRNINIKPIYRYGDEIDSPKMITLISSSRCARIMIEDIEMIEQEGRILHIITANKDYTVYESINTIAAMLNGNSFYRPLKGLIINFDHIKEIEESYINFESGQSAVVGRNTLCMTRNAFRKYLMGYPAYISKETSGVRVAERD